MWFRVFVAIAVASLNLSAQTPQTPAEAARALFDQAVTDFRDGRVKESADGFDKLATLVPTVAPQLWQRGIALYYAGRYQDCRAQFESHRTVNPNDVENAAWHFLCVAKAESPARAKAALLPVGPDSRVPMGQIYRMFAGTMTPDEVMTAAGAGLESTFYAHLYIGLYQDATGNAAGARQHITEAAADRYALPGGYMAIVAKIHLNQLNRR